VVRLVPSLRLADAMGQLDTISGIASVSIDPILRGANGGNFNGKFNGKKNGKPFQPAFTGPSMWHLAAMRLGPALNIQPNASGVTVALLDTGLSTDVSGDAQAPGLESTPILSGEDFINADADPADDNGHGTLLAGILASDGEFRGVAQDVSILPVKVLDHERLGTESALVEGIDYAVAQGADVISMSLAFPPGYVPSYELSEAIHSASAAGVVLVAAAGNHGSGEVGYPAAFGEVIAVGGGRLVKNVKPMDTDDALDVHGSNIASKLAKAEYSGWSAAVDVLAPGGSVNHDLDGDGFPDAIAAVGLTATDPNYAGYLIAGTSPAAAQAAGLASLLLAGGADAGDVRPLMMSNAHGLGPAGFDIFNGSGVVDAYQSVKQLSHGNVPQPPKVYVNPILTIATDTDGNRRGIAMVEVIDDSNEPVVGARVLGHFRGPVTHSSEAITDAQGRAIMVSSAALATSDLFEFGVDKVIQCDDGGSCGDGCDAEIISVPGTFARFDEVSFHFFAAFRPGGVGVEPEPFMIFIPPDALTSVIGDFSLSGTTGAPATPELIDTIPADLASYTMVESLLVRSFGSAGSVGPVVFAIDKVVLASNCAIADGGVVIPSGGVGVEPEPFRIGEDLIGLPPNFNEVTLRSDGGLFLNGDPTTESQLGMLSGTIGSVAIQVDGSVCLAQSIDVRDTGVFTPGASSASGVSVGGVSYKVSASSSQTPAAPFTLGDTTLGTAIGQGVVSSSSLGGAAQASAALDGIQP
jgi:hypothetical protein